MIVSVKNKKMKNKFLPPPEFDPKTLATLFFAFFGALIGVGIGFFGTYFKFKWLVIVGICITLIAILVGTIMFILGVFFFGRLIVKKLKKQTINN